MDLSNFSKSLPLSIEPTDDAMNTLNKEISDEFKCGARSIAALYRLSNTKNQLLMAKGYIDCLNDLSKLIDSEKLLSIKDLRDFIHLKKKDLTPISFEKEKDKTSSTNHKLHDDIPNSGLLPTDTVDDSHTISNVQPSLTDIDDSYKFTLNYPSTHHFPKSRIPLSIDHSNLKSQKFSKSLKKVSDHSSDEEEVEDTDNEHDQDGSDLSFCELTDSFPKRKIHDSTIIAHKKTKL